MKSILIVYSKMVVGGSTTSLLSLLNSIDYNQYQVDLLLYENDGELQSEINQNVNILPAAVKSRNPMRKLLNPNYITSLIKARMLSKKYNNRLINSQIMAKFEAGCCSTLLRQYDVGISFLEFWPCEYLVCRVNAIKKIGWIHIDIKEAKLLKESCKNAYSKLDNIVMVSPECVNNFKLLYPDLSHKVLCIENILSEKTILDFSKKDNPLNINRNCLNIISVCRIVFASKGIDRGVKAFEKLKKDGLLGSNVMWYIVGDGPDMQSLGNMISKSNLQENIILLGKQLNPYSYLKDMDIFLLPSRYEGKPMAVTEAQMLGVVPLVCNYSSAKNQVKHLFDGVIAENNDEDIYFVLKRIIQKEIDVSKLKTAIQSKNYSNTEEIEKIYKLIED